MDDKFTILFDMDDRYRVVDWRFERPVVTVDTFTRVEAMTLMWAFEEHPERADHGYIEWRQM